MSDAGEILARLKLDASDFLTKLEEAKGEAKSLDGVDPKIQVTADTAGAIAGLQATKVEADRLGGLDARIKVSTDAASAVAGLATARQAAMALSAEQFRLTDANRALRQATMEYGNALEKEGADSATASNALDRYITAKDRVASSTERITRLSGALTDAEKAEADAAKTAAAAQNDAAGAADKAGRAADDAGKKTAGAAKGAIPWMGILVGSIAAVAPGIVAVGAAAIGLSGSLVGLGVAGVLAFKGIQAEMAAGTDLGNKYSTLFDGLTNDLSLLEHTAAAGIFTGLSTGVRTLEADIGPLNQDVDLLSRQLGGLLATGATTAVHAFNGFTPVLVAAGSSLQGFLHGIDSFTSSNGFTAFIDYTVARLPDVMHLIDSTLGAVGGIFSALAPAGQSTLFMLSSLMDLITALAPTVGALMPTVIGLSDAIGGIALVVGHVLTALGPLGPVLVGTTGAFIGLGFASRALAPAVLAAADAEGVAAVATRGLGAAVDFAMGPVGLLIIGAGLFVSALATMGPAASTAAASVTDLTSALQQDNGVVGQNTQALVANGLASSGAFDAASKLGISTKTLTAAATGQAAAQKQVNAAVAANAAPTGLAAQMTSRYGDHLTAAQKASTQVAAAVRGSNTALAQATVAYNKIATATGQATMTQKQLGAAAAAVHMPVAEFAAAAAAQAKTAATAQQTRDQYILLGDAANLLKLDMDKLNGATISNAEAQAAWASGLDSLKSSFNSSSKAITGNSRAALENRGAVASLVATGETALQQYANTNHSIGQTTAQYKSMRSALISQISALTGNKAAAAALVDQYFKIPKNIKTDFQGNDADAKAAAARATAAGKAFARGDYKAAYKADPSPANRAKADAMAKAEQFAHAQYMAVLKANPQPANANSADAARKAHSYAAGFYQAVLRANDGPAMSAIDQTRAQLRAIDGTTATVYVSAVAAGVSYAQSAAINRNAQMFHADGGSIGMAGGGTPGMFSGSVSGPGNSWNDMAGRYNLADREFVMSNKQGQADWSRPFLEAINSQKVKTPAQLGQMAGGGSHQGPTTVINRTIAPEVHIHNPVAVDPVQQVIDANQYVLAYSGLG